LAIPGPGKTLSSLSSPVTPGFPSSHSFHPYPEARRNFLVTAQDHRSGNVDRESNTTKLHIPQIPHFPTLILFFYRKQKQQVATKLLIPQLMEWAVQCMVWSRDPGCLDRINSRLSLRE